jgi:hypothetical protein
VISLADTAGKSGIPTRIILVAERILTSRAEGALRVMVVPLILRVGLVAVALPSGVVYPMEQEAVKQAGVNLQLGAEIVAVVN